jgi:hypothetical protein
VYTIIFWVYFEETGLVFAVKRKESKGHYNENNACMKCGNQRSFRLSWTLLTSVIYFYGPSLTVSLQIEEKISSASILALKSP